MSLTSQEHWTRELTNFSASEGLLKRCCSAPWTITAGVVSKSISPSFCVSPYLNANPNQSSSAVFNLTPRHFTIMTLGLADGGHDGQMQ